MSRDRDNNRMALAVLDTIANMYSTFQNKQLANAEIESRKEIQKINNQHLVDFNNHKQNLNAQEESLMQIFNQNNRELQNIRNDVKNLGLVESDFVDLADKHKTPGGDEVLTGLKNSYIDGFNVRYNVGKTVQENISNIEKANQIGDAYIDDIKNRLSILHDDINFFQQDFIKKEGYPEGTPPQYIPEYENIFDKSDINRFIDKYSPFHPEHNINGYNVDDVNNWPDEFQVSDGQTIKKSQLIEAINSGDIQSENEIRNFWKNSTARKEAFADNILFDPYGVTEDKVDDIRSKLWEKDILNEGGKVLPKSLFDKETKLENRIIAERNSIKKLESNEAKRIANLLWENKPENVDTVQKLRASRDKIVVSQAEGSQYKNLPIFKDFGKGLEKLEKTITPNNYEVQKALIGDKIIGALKKYTDRDFTNKNIELDLVGSGLEGKYTTLGDLVDTFDKSQTQHEKNAMLKILHDIIVPSGSERQSSEGMYKEGYLDQLDFYNFIGKGKKENIDVISSWFEHYGNIDKSFQHYDDNVNNILHNMGYTFPKDLGQGRRYFQVNLDGGGSIPILGYDLGLGFNNGIIERSYQDAEFWQSVQFGKTRGIPDKYLESATIDGKKMFRIKEDKISLLKDKLK
tara:strand:- start:3201 stop:5093 length:1893 start_codon:yes stop_codon:yes gene_type:complete